MRKEIEVCLGLGLPYTVHFMRNDVHYRYEVKEQVLEYCDSEGLWVRSNYNGFEIIQGDWMYKEIWEQVQEAMK